jgi:ribose transport system permease protein
METNQNDSSISTVDDAWSAKWLLARSLTLLFAFLATVALLQPQFFTVPNLVAILYYACLLVPVLLGVYLLIIMGQFDLSVGAVASCAGVLAAYLVRAGLNPILSVALAMAAGASFGAGNWALVTVTKVPAIVGTLITMSAARAVALGVSDGRVIAIQDGDLPQWLTFVNSTVAVIVMGVLMVALLELLSHRHVLLRHMHLAGSNSEAVSNVGVNVSRLHFVAFVAAGTGAAASGLLQSARTASSSPIMFQELALECISACIIGGVRFSGGVGNPLGAFVGLLVVVISRNLVIMAGVSIFWQGVCMAIMMLAAAMLNRPAAENGRVGA